MELLACHEQYKVLVALCIQAKKRAVSHKSDEYLKKCGIPLTGKKYKKNRQALVENYFDNLQKVTFDSAFLNLVAIFEKQIFNKISNASGESRKIINDNYKNDNPFYLSIELFVKDINDINKLSNITAMLEGKINSQLFTDLKKTIDYRNRIAHGRRFGDENTMTLDDIVSILSDVLKLVG